MLRLGRQVGSTEGGRTLVEVCERLSGQFGMWLEKTETPVFLASSGHRITPCMHCYHCYLPLGNTGKWGFAGARTILFIVLFTKIIS